MSRELDILAQNIKNAGKTRTIAQLRFARCANVDWPNRTMEAQGVSDDLAYYGVMLGFGYVDIKPKVGSLCLIGILEGKETYSFLVNCDQVELVEINAEKLVANGGENLGLVKVEALTDKLNTIEKSVNDLQNVFNQWTPAPQDGGATLKASISSWAGKPLVETKKKDIENEDITH